jgi:hypothetical protein
MSWQPDRLLRVLLTWTLFTATLPTIVAYRAGVQPLYEWGLYGITGRGRGLPYAVVVATGVLAWTVVVLGYRGARRPFAALLITWHALLLASLLYGVARFGSGMTLQGDAMRLRINLALIGPLVGLTALAASLVWVRKRREREAHDAVPWRSSARTLTAIAVTIGLAIVVLFLQHSGHPHYDADRVAIGLIVAQVLVVARLLDPPRSAPRTAASPGAAAVFGA